MLVKKRYYILIFCIGVLLACWLEGNLVYLYGVASILLTSNNLRKPVVVFLLAVALMQVRFSLIERHISRLEKNANQVSKLTMNVKGREVKGGYRQKITGYSERIDTNVILNLRMFPTIAKGDIIEVNCLLERPEPFDGFSYDKYLYLNRIYYICEPKSKVTILSNDKSGLGLWIYSQINNYWSQPERSLVAGLLLGSRESFSEEVLNQFSRSGITHIIALSGFNISILVFALEALLISILIPRKLRCWFILIAIAIFTLFVGAGASILRAAIMGGMALVSKYIARRVSPIRLMLLTATIMILHQPYILKYDLGFQLSFLSTIGLLYLTPFFQRIFSFIPEVFSLQESFTTTLAATAITLPLILYQFGNLSIISPIANVLVLPVIPFTMLTGALAVIVGPVIEPIGLLFVYLTSMMCKYILDISAWSANLSWAAYDVSISLLTMIILYCLLGLLIYYEQKKTSQLTPLH